MPTDTPEHIDQLRAPLQCLLRMLEREAALAQRLGVEVPLSTQLQIFQTRERLQALEKRVSDLHHP